MKKNFVLGLALALTSGAFAATIDVATGDTQGWGPGDIRNGGTAGITGMTDDLGGTGALCFSLPDGSAKAEWQIYGDFGNLADLTSLSYSWYRDGASTNPANQFPVLRLIVADPTTLRLSYLIYEPVYNADPLTADVWHTSDALGGNFWAWAIGAGGGAVNVYDTLNDYMTTDNGANDYINADARVIGFNMGVGSGWNGEFTGYVDHLSFDFGTGENTTWDFVEAGAPVPEPATLGLMLMGLGGLVARNRRKRA